MSLLEKEFEALGRETAKKIEGLRRAAGRINELEALAEAINAHMTSWPVVPVVCAHSSGHVGTWINVSGAHAKLRDALIKCGLQIEAEVELPPSAGKSVSHIRLAGLDSEITIRMEDERFVLPLAA